MSLGKLSRAKLPKEVKAFVSDVRAYIGFLDAMVKPGAKISGADLAKLTNALEMAVDRMEHFGIKAKKPHPAIAALQEWINCGCGHCENAEHRECPALVKLAAVKP